jgi:hypothetical protein
VHQQLWGYKVEEKICLRARERKRLNIVFLSHLEHSRSEITQSRLYGNYGIELPRGWVFIKLRNRLCFLKGSKVLENDIT